MAENKPYKTSGLYIKSDGSQKKIYPQDGKRFALKEMQQLVGGLVQVVRLPELPEKGLMMVMNEEGRLKVLPRNAPAEELFRKAWPLEIYPHNNDGIVVGDVLVVHRKLL